jgi:hypothetical protein
VSTRLKSPGAFLPFIVRSCGSTGALLILLIPRGKVRTFPTSQTEFGLTVVGLTANLQLFHFIQECLIVDL